MGEIKAEPFKVWVGKGLNDWISLDPQINVEELSDGDRLITFKGVYRLQGKNPETYWLTRLF